MLRCIHGIITTIVWGIYISICGLQYVSAEQITNTHPVKEQWAIVATGLIEQLSELSNSMPKNEVSNEKTESLKYFGGRDPEEITTLLPDMRAADKLLWKLWAVTGKPVVQQSDESFRAYLQKNVKSYKRYVADHMNLNEEELHLIGLFKAVDTLSTPYWYASFKYIQLRTRNGDTWEIDVRTTPSFFIVKWPLDARYHSQLRVAYSKWLKHNLRNMIWDAKIMRFRPKDGVYTKAETKAVLDAVQEAIFPRKKARKGVRESAGQSRQGVADERAVRERASDPSRP